MAVNWSELSGAETAEYNYTFTLTLTRAFALAPTLAHSLTLTLV